jgi:hypothetical protein
MRNCYVLLVLVSFLSLFAFGCSNSTPEPTVVDDAETIVPPWEGSMIVDLDNRKIALLFPGDGDAEITKEVLDAAIVPKGTNSGEYMNFPILNQPFFRKARIQLCGGENQGTIQVLAESEKCALYFEASTLPGDPKCGGGVCGPVHSTRLSSIVNAIPKDARHKDACQELLEAYKAYKD